MRPCFLHSTTGLKEALVSLDRFSTRQILVAGNSSNRRDSNSKLVSALKKVVDGKTNDRDRTRKYNKHGELKIVAAILARVHIDAC